MSEKLEVAFTNCTELVRVTAVGIIDTVELPTVTEGVMSKDEILPIEGEGVSLKNGLIPEPKSSGVGVGVMLSDWTEVKTIEDDDRLGVLTNDVASILDVNELFCSATELVVGIMSTVVFTVVTEGLIKTDETELLTATGVSLKNGVIPEPDPISSGVGVGVTIMNDVVLITD